MFLREIVQALERVERNQAVILRQLAVLGRNQTATLEQLDALPRIERNLEPVLSRLDKLEHKAGNAEKAPDEWMQDGIDNILGYQAGKKKEGRE